MEVIVRNDDVVCCLYVYVRASSFLEDRIQSVEGAKMNERSALVVIVVSAVDSHSGRVWSVLSPHQD
jgi:hypothetical protein